MNLFIAAPLSIVGRPILLEDEIEIKQHSNCEVLSDHPENAKLLQNVSLIITNLRIVHVVSSASSAGSKGYIGWALDLSTISAVEDCSGILNRSKRLRLKFIKADNIISIRYLSGVSDKDESLLIIQKQLIKRSWESIARAKQASLSLESQSKFSTSNAGVSGLIRKQEKDINTTKTITQQSLQDLDSLMKSAREVVQIVEKYAAYTQEREDRQKSTSSSHKNDSDPTTTTTTDNSIEENELEDILHTIGMISPVTKCSAGRLYHQELSRQLADFLLRGIYAVYVQYFMPQCYANIYMYIFVCMISGNILKRLGGIASLVDLYCLYNRARGTELVSPDDFLKAAESINNLNCGLLYKKYKSGVISIAQISSTGDRPETLILKLFSENNGHQYDKIGMVIQIYDVI